MTPFSFEWQWNIEYFIFMGLVYLALGIIGCGLIYCAVKTWLDIDEDGRVIYSAVKTWLGISGEQDQPPDIPSRSKYSEY